ncbi:hypothetical protein LTR85_007762 [Meristemomyces frigidus]|nr:hypothetical protein LTR85_007762 [Meristemomyces frigidus]
MADSLRSASPQSEQPCFLFTFPQGLLDIVFTRGNVLRGIISKRDWDHEEQEKKKMNRANYRVRPFSDEKITQFLISKEFFVGAANAYMSAQKWDAISVTDFLCQRKEVGLFFQFARDVSLTGSLIRDLRFCRNLRSLTLTVTHLQFDDLLNKVVWEDPCHAVDFRRLRFAKDLRKLPGGLQRLVITAGRRRYANTASKVEIWNTNVKRSRKFILHDLSRPRETRAEKGNNKRNKRPTPLYFGSRMCFDPSIVLPERPRWHAIFGADPFGCEDDHLESDEEGTEDLSKAKHGTVTEEVDGLSRRGQDGELAGRGNTEQVEMQEDKKRSDESSVKGGMRDDELPDSEAELIALISERDQDVMAWIRRKKSR